MYLYVSPRFRRVIRLAVVVAELVEGRYGVGQHCNCFVKTPEFPVECSQGAADDGLPRMYRNDLPLVAQPGGDLRNLSSRPAN